MFLNKGEYYYYFYYSYTYPLSCRLQKSFSMCCWPFVPTMNIWLALGPARDILQSVVIHDLVYPTAKTKLYIFQLKKNTCWQLPQLKVYVSCHYLVIGIMILNLLLPARDLLQLVIVHELLCT